MKRRESRSRAIRSRGSSIMQLQIKIRFIRLACVGQSAASTTLPLLLFIRLAKESTPVVLGGGESLILALQAALIGKTFHREK